MKKNNLILCSAIKGLVSNHGQPMAGVIIQREIQWNLEQQPRIDSAVTDVRGCYSFSVVEGYCEMTFLEHLFHRPRIQQTLKLIQGEYAMLIFSGIRTHYLPPSGLEADYVQITSDLKNAIEVDPAQFKIKSIVKEYLAA